MPQKSDECSVFEQAFRSDLLKLNTIISSAGVLADYTFWEIKARIRQGGQNESSGLAPLR